MTWYPLDTEKIKKLSDQTNLWYQLNYDQLDKNEKLIRENPIIINGSIVRLMDQVIDRRRRLLFQLREEAVCKCLIGRTDYGIVHGLGAAHVRESGLTIHPIYGVPYIPASSMKGIVHHWAQLAFKDRHKITSTIERLFGGDGTNGTKKRRGITQFYDVYLYHRCQLHPDMNTRLYSEYYEGKQDASDTMNAVPSGKFYTVTADNIEIVISVKKSNVYDADQYLKLLANWTVKALTEVGIGARSSAGFGYMTAIEDKTNTIFAVIEKQEQERQEKWQAEQAKKQLAQKLANMSDTERLVFKIGQLNPKDKNDQQSSKSEYFEQVQATQNREAAAKLRDYWQLIGSWKVKKGKKQWKKVETIKAILDE
jgi:CRISPR-associated protein Cmr6